MGDTGVLVVGLASLAASIVVAVLVVQGGRAEPTGVGRSLAAIRDLTLDSQVAVEGTGELSFLDRVLRPLAGRLGRMSARLSPAGTTARLQRLLDRAGNPERWTPERLLAAKGLGLLGLGALGALLGSRSVGHFLIFTSVGAAAGFWLPDILIYNSGLKRQQTIRKTLADALDLLTVSVEAGLGFDAALSQVARNTSGPIAGEFFRVLQEMQIGKSRREALRGLGERTTVPELRTFTSAIVQGDTLGIPIANVLREQAKEMRIKRQQRAEEQAQKVSVKMMFPLVLFIMPALFVIVIGPGVIAIIHSFSGRF